MRTREHADRFNNAGCQQMLIALKSYRSEIQTALKASRFERAWL